MNDPVCYKCKETGHLAVDCKKFSKQLKMYGFGIPGQGFYALNFPEEKLKASKATRVINIVQGDASEDKLNRELRNLVREDWDFKVRQLDSQAYLVIFPDAQSLNTFDKLSGFDLPLFNLKVKLEKSI